MKSSTNCRRTPAAWIPTVWACALLGAAGMASTARAETVDYVTETGAGRYCHIKLDEEGNDRSLLLQPGTTKFELWANFIDFVTTREVIVDDTDSGSVTLTIGQKHSGLDNLSRGCEAKGSVEVTVTATRGSTANLRRTLRLKSSDRTFDQPVNVMALPGFALTWLDTLTPPSCLIRSPSGSSQFQLNNKRLEIHLPPGHLTDVSNCSGDLKLKADYASYSVNLKDETSPDFSLAHALTAQQLVPRVTGTRTVVIGGVSRIIPLLGSGYQVVSPPPAIYTADSNSLKAFNTDQTNVTLHLDPIQIRKLTRQTKFTVTLTNPNGKADSVEMEIFPTDSNGFTVANCTPDPVQVGSQITCRVTFAQPLAQATNVVWKLSDPQCFEAVVGQVPFTATPTDPNAEQNPVSVAAGAQIKDFIVRAKGGGSCASLAGNTHLFEAAIGNDIVPNPPAGTYIAESFRMTTPPN